MDARAVVDKFFAHMNAHDHDEVLDLMADDLDWWIAGNLPISGSRTKAELTGLLSGFFAALPDFRFVVHSTTCEGNRVAVEAESQGTKTDGKRYHNRYHYLFEVTDGLIRVGREYMDTQHASDVFGTT